MASSAATLDVFTLLVIVSSLGQPAEGAIACRDCASSCSSLNYATPTGPCGCDCSPEPLCLQNCKPPEIAKCMSACKGSCNTGCRGSCDCDGTCSNNCAGAGGVCTSRCTNSTVCQACKDKYAQQCITTCNANCV